MRKIKTKPRVEEETVVGKEVTELLSVKSGR